MEEILTPYVVCPTKNCKFAITFGAITTKNRQEWADGFESKKITCPVCRNESRYTKSDLYFQTTMVANER